MDLITVSISRHGKFVWSGDALFAEAAADRQAGLSEFDQIDPGSGMLFRVLPGEAFTMRPMRTSLDMIWAGNGHVVRVDRNLPPGSGTVRAPMGAELLLEIGGGEAFRVMPGYSVSVAQFVIRI